MEKDPGDREALKVFVGSLICKTSLQPFPFPCAVWNQIPGVARPDDLVMRPLRIQRQSYKECGDSAWVNSQLCGHLGGESKRQVLFFFCIGKMMPKNNIFFAKIFGTKLHGLTKTEVPDLKKTRLCRYKECKAGLVGNCHCFRAIFLLFFRGRLYEE